MKKLPTRRPNPKEKAGANTPAVKKSLSFGQIVSLLIVATIVLLGGSGYYWYKNVLTNPDRIISGMLDASMQTTSVNRVINQNQGDSSITQTMQTSFSPKLVTKSVTDLSEISDLGRTSVTTETIGNATDDYVRYTAIDIQNPQNKRNFSSVLNTWGTRKGNPSVGQEPSFLNTSLFVAVPFGNLNAEQRSKVKNEIAKQQLYKYDEAKLEYVSGRPVMNYTLKLKPQALVSVLAKYADVTGVGSKTDLDPSTYEGASAINVKLQVDTLTRHIRSIEFVDSNRTETYQAYNPATSINIPTKTIDVNELQTRLTAIESGKQ